MSTRQSDLSALYPQFGLVVSLLQKAGIRPADGLALAMPFPGGRLGFGGPYHVPLESRLRLTSEKKVGRRYWLLLPERPRYQLVPYVFTLTKNLGDIVVLRMDVCSVNWY